MVQRIQSIYLALVALFHFLLFFIPIFTWDRSTVGEPGFWTMTASYTIPFTILNILIILFSIFVITQYKSRKKQRNLVFMLAAIIMVFVALCMFQMFRITTTSQYAFIPSRSFGMFLQLTSIILCLFASRRIKKDDDLVKSVDRIR
jgi:Zn-dependent protease